MSLAPRARPPAAALVRAGQAVAATPSTRYVLTQDAWADLADRLHSDPLPLVSLWADERMVHALFLEGIDTPVIASVPIEARRYLALSQARPAAAVQERSIRDLWGVEAMGARDLRPWLDHGHWGSTAPLSARPGPAAWPPEPPELLGAASDEAAGWFQLGIGPVQSLVAGPAHLRLAMDGEAIRRLEVRLGYAHRGIAGLVRGRTPAEAAPLVGRTDAETTVAHQAAFGRAVEAALGWRITARAAALRMVMAELERMAVHLRHLGLTAEAVGLDNAAEHAAGLRETTLQACETAFGHRLLLDTIVPGGLARLPTEAGLAALPPMLDRLLAGLPALQRTMCGRLGARRLAHRAVLGAPFVGDALRRSEIRLTEIVQSVARARQLLAADPDGPVRGERPPAPDLFAPAVEAIGEAASAHGPVWHWLRLEGGAVTAFHAYDPQAALWAALEPAAAGLDMTGFTLLCRSIGLSVPGSDQ